MGLNPEQPREWYRVTAAQANSGPKRATVSIYDVIGADPFFGGIDVAELVAEIDALGVDELEVRINSPGGSAYDGLAVANAIMRNTAKTTTYIDGLAASAASLIALAGDQVVMSKYGQMMLHNARNGVYGTAAEHRDAAKFLDSLNGAMAEFYADRAGGDAPTWTKAMARETWYRADEALDAGLITEIDASAKRDDIEANTAAAIAKAAALFKYPGRQAAPAPAMRAEHGPSGPDDKEDNVPSEKVLERLGLPADATEDDLLAKLDELKPSGDGGPEAATDDADDAPPVDTPAEPKPELAAALAVAEAAGMVLIPQARLQSLEDHQARLQSLEDRQTAAAHAEVVDGAIGQGKITPAERDQFVALMKADAVTTTKVLDGIPAEARVPISEVGHSTEPVTNVADDPTYKNWSF